MSMVVTGGGTGGHVFPALEVARFAREQGMEVAYFGSVRGQEAVVAPRAGLAFEGFGSEPIYSIRTPRGWRALMRLWRASSAAKAKLLSYKPSVVFSTGGYSSAPVVQAARRLGIPYVVHEQNSVPGRTNQILGRTARSVAVTFEVTKRHFAGHTVRTGMPVRSELRALAGQMHLDAGEGHGRVLVVGGSQGAAAVNEAALATAQRLASRNVRWLNVTGKKHFETIFASYEKLGISNLYEMKSYLEATAMGEEYSRSSFVVARSGAGTLSELAAFRLPAVLIPYPQAFANHQFHNAKEFVDLGAASLIEQTDLHPARLETELLAWIDDPMRIRKAQEALAMWDTPNATADIFRLLNS